MKKYILLFIISLAAFSSTAIIEDILIDMNWINDEEKTDNVITTPVITGDQIKSEILNAKFKALNKKIKRAKCKKNNGFYDFPNETCLQKLSELSYGVLNDIEEGVDISISVDSISLGDGSIPSYSIVSGPVGLSIDASTGELFGNVLGINEYTVVVRAENDISSIQEEISLNVIEVSGLSCLDILNKRQDLLNSGTATYSVNGQDILCDMTTEGGGWTVLVADNTTDLAYLSKFGSTAQITSTFYTDSNYGIGWGTNDDSYKVLDISTQPFSEVYIQHSGFYNIPAGGLGYMYINTNNETILSSGDAWTDSSAGQSLTVQGNQIYRQSQSNDNNRVHSIDVVESNQIAVGMKGYTSSYGYTKRYLNRLMIR